MMPSDPAHTPNWHADGVLAAILRTVNAPRPVEIDGPTLIAAITQPDGESQKRWRPHVEALLDEVAPEMLHRWVLTGAVDFPQLAEAQRRWQYRGRSAEWIDEMAAFRVAQTAAADLAVH